MGPACSMGISTRDVCSKSKDWKRESVLASMREDFGAGSSSWASCRVLSLSSSRLARKNGRSRHGVRVRVRPLSSAKDREKYPRCFDIDPTEFLTNTLARSFRAEPEVVGRGIWRLISVHYNGKLRVGGPSVAISIPCIVTVGSPTIVRRTVKLGSYPEVRERVRYGANVQDAALAGHDILTRSQSEQASKRDHWMPAAWVATTMERSYHGKVHDNAVTVHKASSCLSLLLL
ncbi:hypothetical protein KM043_011545 [Ampulex compressa]|nr:hypothetical protein KM043_011545 [Ampulex compressa]